MTNGELKILYEDENYLVVDKDKDVAVHAGNQIEERKILLLQLKEYLTNRNNKAPDFINPSHRLDMNTQGPVFFTKNPEAAAVLQRAFSSGNVMKTYHALLEGKLEAPIFIEADIVKNSHKKALVRNMKLQKEDFPSREEWLAKKDKKARTLSATLIFPMQRTEQATFCHVETWTGRYHQIRAICEAIGHQICGDAKYNHNPREHYHRTTNEKYPLGQMLLCKRIEIPAIGIAVTSGFDLVF